MFGRALRAQPDDHDERGPRGADPGPRGGRAGAPLLALLTHPSAGKLLATLGLDATELRAAAEQALARPAAGAINVERRVPRRGLDEAAIRASFGPVGEDPE